MEHAHVDWNHGQNDPTTPNNTASNNRECAAFAACHRSTILYVMCVLLCCCVAPHMNHTLNSLQTPPPPPPPLGGGGGGGEVCKENVLKSKTCRRRTFHSTKYEVVGGATRDRANETAFSMNESAILRVARRVFLGATCGAVLTGPDWQNFLVRCALVCAFACVCSPVHLCVRLCVVRPYICACARLSLRACMCTWASCISACVLVIMCSRHPTRTRLWWDSQAGRDIFRRRGAACFQMCMRIAIVRAMHLSCPPTPCPRCVGTVGDSR